VSCNYLMLKMALNLIALGFRVQNNYLNRKEYLKCPDYYTGTGTIVRGGRNIGILL
jgi:hypothetical protein